MRILAFPGQGAQATGMGGELFDRFPEVVAEADAILGYSTAGLCRCNPDGALARTQYAQPALFVVETLALLAHRQDDPGPADYMIGHSLGEYTALHAAGVFDFGTGLRLVRRRGELMSRAGQGGMAAVLGLDGDDVTALLGRLGLHELDVALVNAPGQVAVAGPDDVIDALLEGAAEASVRCVRLNVSGAFHSRYQRDAAEEFARSLANVPLAAPAVPVIANVTARPHRPERIAEDLVRQLVQPVRWTESIEWLLAQADGDLEFIELGPGTTLTGMLRRIQAALAPPACGLTPEESLS